MAAASAASSQTDSILRPAVAALQATVIRYLGQRQPGWENLVADALHAVACTLSAPAWRQTFSHRLDALADGGDRR